MNFVNKEKLHFINDYPGKIVVFLLGRAYSYSNTILDTEFLNAFPEGKIYSFDSHIDSYNEFYIEGLLASILNNLISTTNYILVQDWYTKIEYEYINKHPMLYSITIGFDNGLNTNLYDLLLLKEKPVGEQLVQYINKLKEGEK